MHRNHILRQLLDETAKLDSRKVRRRIKQLMNRSNGPYPGLHLQQHGLRIGLTQVLRLQVEQAGNDLQIVLDPVVNLLQQSFLLGQGSAELLLLVLEPNRGPVSLGNIAHDLGEAAYPPAGVANRCQNSVGKENAPILAEVPSLIQTGAAGARVFHLDLRTSGRYIHRSKDSLK